MNFKYQVGSIIQYNSFSEQRLVRVTAKESDIKNGEPGFDGVVVKYQDGVWVDTSRMVWGYDDQICGVCQL